MPGLPLSTRLTVASLTPAYFATSASRRVMPASVVHDFAIFCTMSPTQPRDPGSCRCDARKIPDFPGITAAGQGDRDFAAAVPRTHDLQVEAPPDGQQVA